MFAFRPALVTALRGYNRRAFVADFVSGITVGIIALPLAIGFGIASHVTPAQGLWTAIIAGLLISLFGGSAVQIGGPTGAFVPILAAIVFKHGYEGLALATMMAGVFMFMIGALRMGSLLKFIPFPVVAGFTSGIAVVIAVGQLKELLGLHGKMPAEALSQFCAILAHIKETNIPSFLIGLLALAILIFWPKKWRAVPASIVAIIVTTVVVVVMHPAVATIGSKFGGIPQGFAPLTLPHITFNRIQELMLPALTITILGSIESLLSAMVADGMIDERHDANQELMGQGIANFLSPLFGGISATGAVARTATNVRSGGRTPVAGIVHAFTLLVIVLVAAPLAKSLPVSALCAVLLMVAYRMGEWENFSVLARGPRGDFLVLIATFGITVAFDLTVAVGVGLVLAAALFVRQMEAITHIRMVTDETEVGGGSVEDSLRGKTVPEGVVVYRMDGPFFFGAAEKLEFALSRSQTTPKVIVFRMRTVPAMDASGLRALQHVQEKLNRRGTSFILSGVQPQPMKVLFKAGFIDKVGLENICANIDVSLARAAKIVTGIAESAGAEHRLAVAQT